MEPYYTIEPETKNIITELIKKCEELNLGNVNFSFYRPRHVDFYISQYKKYWEMVVKCDYKTDIHRITDTIVFQHSEEG